MLIDEKNDQKSPPQYSETVLPLSNEAGSSASASASASYPQGHIRKQSVLYESDMEDPFSNRAAQTPGAATRRDSELGFFGNGTNVFPPPPGPPPSGAGSRLRPISGNSYEYVPTNSAGPSGGFGSFGERRSAYGVGVDVSPRGTYYDSELDERERQSLHSSPTQELGDMSPLVNRKPPNQGSLSSGNLLGKDTEAQQRGLQPLGKNHSSRVYSFLYE